MEELNCNFFNPNWENSMDQNDPFESALSSMVSSPTNGNNINNGGENIVVRELIGRLGSLRNSPFGNNNTNTSCYSTPLNSPPKLNLSAMESQSLQIHGNPFPSFPFSTDPGFVERAAKFSCFAQIGLSEIGQKLESGKISRVSSNLSIKVPGSEQRTEIGDSREISSISEQIPSGDFGLNVQNDPNSRKRKSAQKGKGKENPVPAKDAKVGSGSNESSAKRSKSEDGSKSENDAVRKNVNGKSKDDSKASEPPKDYIHVRARRGQATDAHSLAERVRREKISERMKLLQDLVPGCNKVTGKAVMLDEIINYVQSLQRQVEFLSMKLSTVNPRMDLEALVSKDMFQSRGSLPPNMYPSDCYPFQSQPSLLTAIANGTEELNHFNAALSRNQLPSMNNFNDTASQVSTFWENDLHNVVQMGYGQNQSHDFHGVPMKVEP